MSDVRLSDLIRGIKEAYSCSQSEYHNCEFWTSEQWDRVNQAVKAAVDAADARDEEMRQLKTEIEKWIERGAPIEGTYWSKGTLLIDELKDKNKQLREALAIAANRLEGVSIAIQAHGTNINVSFFISEFKSYADEARTVLKVEERSE